MDKSLKAPRWDARATALGWATVGGLSALRAFAAAVILLLSLLAPVYASEAAGSPVKVLITIDPAKFNDATITNLGGKIVYKSKLANIIAAEVPDAALQALANAPGVIRVSIDTNARTMDTVPWGVNYVNAPTVWNTYGVDGSLDLNGDGNRDIEVAVIDTGVDPNHPDLAGNIAWCVSTIGGALTANCNDGNGHGTHVIGTIAAIINGQGVVGVAPGVEIYAIKALDDQGSGSFTDIIAAIEAAIAGPDGVVDADGDGVVAGDPDDDAAEVISMSLGGAIAPPELQTVIRSAYNLGIVVVAAAGNEGAAQPAYPAAYPEVIAVGAIDSTEQVPWWSNDYPEVVAPGVDILSTLPGGQYGTMSGTSMATPHISAIVALIQAARLANGLPLIPPGTDTDMTPDTVRGVLHLAAKDLGPAGYDRNYGYGAVQADAALVLALGGGQQTGTQVELLSNGGYDADASGWSFYPGTYIDTAVYHSSILNASGVVEISGTIPAWQGRVTDYAFIGQQVSFPASASGDGTVTVVFYADTKYADVSLVVAIYDTTNNQFVWYDIVPVNTGAWYKATITVPATTISQVAGGTYLFLVGIGVDTVTFWRSDWAALYLDSVSFTVNA